MSARRTRLFCSPASAAHACWLLLLILVPALLRAEPICLEVGAGRRHVASVPVTLGSEVRLSFRHSLYDSVVQEEFRVARDGLQITRIRYAEPRLVEFYGHELARYQSGSWVVIPERRHFVALDLRMSPDSSMQLSLGPRLISLGELAEGGTAVRVTVTSCSRDNNGQPSD